MIIAVVLSSLRCRRDFAVLHQQTPMDLCHFPRQSQIPRFNDKSDKLCGQRFSGEHLADTREETIEDRLPPLPRYVRRRQYRAILEKVIRKAVVVD